MWTRRKFLGAGASPFVSRLLPQSEEKRAAAFVTMYTDDSRLKSHAAVIVGRVLEGYTPDNVRVESRSRVVSMFTDQVPSNDLSRGLAAEHGFTIYPTIEEALRFGSETLQVDGVLLIGEHGDYPRNEVGQKLYPRYEMFEQMVETFRSTGSSVPVFCDKHFSYSWAKAKRMVDWSRELDFPLLAGSSIPVTVRTGALEIPWGASFEHALAVGYGDTDAYGFHTLESLQCMIERRAGGETGLAWVEMVEGDAVWRWRDSDDGRWSIPLLEAALAVGRSPMPGPIESNVEKPVLFLLGYRDGLRACAYLLNGQVRDFLFAGKLAGQPDPGACLFGFAEGGRPLAHFDGLAHCIDELFVHGRVLNPVERTLLTTGALSFLFESRRRKARVETPELDIVYQAPRNAYFQRA